jgi:hypothetical protein
MFTIKYRSYRPLTNSLTNYVTHELIDGPFSLVSQEVDEDGHIVVHAHRTSAESGTMFGPWVPCVGDPTPGPIVWVMNENGATVAKYDL